MKKLLLSSVLVFLAVFAFSQPLSGTYTINAGLPTSGTNYQTFSAAFSALTTNGVSGPVTMNVVEGTYTEQVYLGNGTTISGTSSTNTVTIQSAPSNTNMPIWQYSSYPIYWYYANLSYLTIKGLNIATTGGSFVVYNYYGNYDNVNFIDNVLDGYSIASTSNSYSIVYSYYGTRDNCHFTNNVFNNGSYGIYYYYGNSTDYYVEGNTFSNQAYTSLYHYASTSATYASRIHVNNNDIDIAGYTTVYGIYTRYCAPGSEMIGNEVVISNTNSSSTTYGIYYYYANYNANSERSLLANNMVTTNEGTGTHYAMYVYYTKNTDVWHNSVQMGSSSTNARAIYFYLGSSSTIYGNNTLYNNIFTTTNTGPYTAYVYQFNFNGGGNNLYWDGAALYNYWYTGGSNSTTYDLTTFNSMSATTGNFSEAPGFMASNDLHVFNPNIDGAGFNVGLNYDIDNQSRVVSIPDIGADEFVVPADDAEGYALISPINPLCNDSSDVTVAIRNTGTNNLTTATIEWSINAIPQPSFSWTGNLISAGIDTVTIANMIPINDEDFIKVWTALPNGQVEINAANDTVSNEAFYGLNGLYTIGTSAGNDYSSFSDAAADLIARGVCGPTVFEVKDGVYTEQIELTSIYGSSEINTITFRSENMDSSLVTLEYTSSTLGDNYVVKLSGAEHVTFEHLTIENLYTSSYSTAVDFAGGANYNTIQNCHLISNYNISTTTYASVIYSASGTTDEYNTIQNNLLEGGGYGMYWYGVNTSLLERGNVIQNNDIRDCYYYGANIYYQDASVFSFNTITSSSTYTNGYGAQLGYCDNGLVAEGNHIYTTPGSVWPYYGFRTYYSDGTVSNPGIVQNNLIVLGDHGSSGNTFYALNAYYSYYTLYQNNTSVVRNGSTSSVGLYAYYNYNNQFINNLIVTYGGGYALYANYGNPSPDVMDYNNYYADPNVDLAYWYGTTQQDLSGLQMASGLDASSTEFDPVFTDTVGGIHCNSNINNTGMPISSVTTDFYGELRSTSPDMGAVEFMPGGAFDLGPDSTYCQSEYMLSVNEPFESIFWNSNGLPSSTASTYPLSAANAPTTFTVNVVVTTSHCDLAFGSQTITLVPNIDFDSSGAHLCPGESIVLNAGGGSTASYNWAPQSSTSKTLNVNSSGIYIATKEEMGCISKDTITVTATSSPALSNMEVCDESIPYTADASVNGGLTYNWSGGSSTSTAVNELSDAGTYTVSITDVYGCDFEHSFDLDVIENPQAQITVQAISANSYTFAASSSSNVGANATYQWTFGPNNATASGMVVTHIFPWSNSQSPQSYDVELMIENECNSSIANTKVNPTVGIDESSSNHGIRVFPNPMQDHAQIAFIGTHTNITIDIIDLTGRTVMTQTETTSNVVNVDVSNLAAGAYSIRVKSDQSPVNVIPVIIQ